MRTLTILFLMLCLGASAASIPGTIVAAKITTGNTANTFSIGDTVEMGGTPKQVADLTERDAITADRRTEGMTCWVINESNEYRLIGGTNNANWVLYSAVTNVLSFTQFVTNDGSYLHLWGTVTNLTAPWALSNDGELFVGTNALAGNLAPGFHTFGSVSYANSNQVPAQFFDMLAADYSGLHNYGLINGGANYSPASATWTLRSSEILGSTNSLAQQAHTGSPWVSATVDGTNRAQLNYAGVWTAAGFIGSISPTNVDLVAGNGITFTTNNHQVTASVPSAGFATNVVWPTQGTNVILTTNGLTVKIDVPSQTNTDLTLVTNIAKSVGQTNLALVVAGTNDFVTPSTNNGVTTFRVDVPNQTIPGLPFTQITNPPWSTLPANALGYLTNDGAGALGWSDILAAPIITNVSIAYITNQYIYETQYVSVSIVTNLTVWNMVDMTTNVTFVTNVVFNKPVNFNTNVYMYGLISTNGITNLTLTANTVLKADGNKAIASIPNGLGALTNDNSGVFGWYDNYLDKGGGTSTGPQLTISATTNNPAGNEFVTGNWVRGLLNNGFFEYVSTNIISGTNADSPDQFLYEFESAIPKPAIRTWPSQWITNNGYIGSVATTNTFLSLAGGVVVNSYIALSGSGNPQVSLKPEIYLSTDRSNWYGDFDAAPQALTPGITQLYAFAVSFPAQTATNTAGFYIQRRYKVTSKAGTPTVTFLIGTNVISGTNNAAHIAINAAAVNSVLPGVVAGTGITVGTNGLAYTVGLSANSVTVNGTANHITTTSASIALGGSATLDIGSDVATQSGNNAFSGNNVFSKTNFTSSNFTTSTNQNQITPDFSVAEQLMTTNASFTFLAPVGVDTTLKTVQWTLCNVTNSSGSLITVTAPANCHPVGTMNVTNLTAFWFQTYAGKFTNCFGVPCW